MALTLADTLAKLEPTVEMVRSVERLLKVWRARIKARNAKADSLRRHRDPDFRARWQAGNDAHYGNAEKEAARIAKMRATRALKVNAFPLGFTTAMRCKVGRLVRKGMARGEAIASVTPSPSERLVSLQGASAIGTPSRSGRHDTSPVVRPIPSARVT